MIDIFQNPIIIAVCEIDNVKFGDDTWHVDGIYQHRNKKRKRHPIRIQAKTEQIIGELTPSVAIIAIGRLSPVGTHRHTHVHANYVSVVTADAGDMANVLEDARRQINQQFDDIQRRIEYLAEWQELEAARQRLEAALCKSNLT